MTSTNDGKDVKSYQTSGQKGKKYYLELYNSLEERLSGSENLAERTQYLCEAWRRIHSICRHAAPPSHPILLAWLERHTAGVTLQSQWQSPDSEAERTALDETLVSVAQDIDAYVSERDGCRQPWEDLLLRRAEWYRSVLGNPWGHPVLKILLDPKQTPPDEETLIEWLRGEREAMVVRRVHELAASKCTDMAVSLAAALTQRRRAALETDTDGPATVQTESKFENILRRECGFTDEGWSFLTDIEFTLLHKADRMTRFIELAKLTPLKNGYDLIDSLQNRPRKAKTSREKKMWKNVNDVAILIAQIMIARCMVIPICAGATRSALYKCAHALCALLPGERVKRDLVSLAAPAVTAAHLYTLAKAVHKQKSSDDMKPFVCELYVRAITSGMNELEKLKLKPDKEKEARQCEQTLATWFLELGSVFASARFGAECALTAFSVHPAPEMYERVKATPELPPVRIADQVQEPKLETNSEFGSWASDSRTQTNFVKTSEHLNMKQQQQSNVLSTAILNEGESLGLSVELCQDIAVLLSGPRVKTLTWDLDREALLANCRAVCERTAGGTRALTTELRYLHLDPGDYLHLPADDSDEDDLYYGIEKGYEHLVEFPEPQPEAVWEDDLIFDAERTESTYSTDSETYPRKARKKKVKKLTYTSCEDEDPLSIVAETKRKEKKKERPHSKERSKGSDTERSKEKKKKPKKERSNSKDKDKEKKKEKKERKKKIKVEKLSTGPLAQLIGVKVERPHDALDSDCDGRSSLAALFAEPPEPNVEYDGHFSMDELKSPDRKSVTPPKFPSSTAGAYETPIKQECHGQSAESSKTSPINQEVKNRIAQLIHFRRNKSTTSTESSNSPASSPVPHTNLPQAATKIKTEPMSTLVGSKIIHATQLPKNVLNSSKQLSNVKEEFVPKKVLNTSQSLQLSNLKEEISNLLKTCTSPTQSTETKSCVNKTINRVTYEPANMKETCSRMVPIKSYSKNRIFTIPELQLKYLENLSREEENQGQVVSKKSAKNVSPASQNTSVPQTKQTQIVAYGDKSHSSPEQKHMNLPHENHARQSVIVDHKSPEKPYQRSFEDFVKDFMNSGVCKDATKERIRRAMKPATKVTPIVPTILKCSRSAPIASDVPHVEATSPQSAKPVAQQKIAENAPNTFSRRSYMHKSKQNDTKPKSVVEQHQLALENQAALERSVSEELDKRIADLHQYKMNIKNNQNTSVSLTKVINTDGVYSKPIESPKVDIFKQPSPHSSLADSHQNSKDMLQMSDVDTNPKVKKATKGKSTNTNSVLKSALSEKDQQDLINMLRQQNKLNEPLRQNKSNANAMLTNLLHLNPAISITNSSFPAVASNLPRAVSNQAVNEPQNIMYQNNQSPNILNQNQCSPKQMEGKDFSAQMISRATILKTADLIHNRIMSSQAKTVTKSVPSTSKTNKAVIKSINLKKPKSVHTEVVVQATPAATTLAKASQDIVRIVKRPSVLNVEKKYELTKKNWTSVMDALRKHKTPSRGPNALEMVLDNAAYEKYSTQSLRNQRIVRPNSEQNNQQTATNQDLKKSIQAASPTEKISKLGSKKPTKTIQPKIEINIEYANNQPVVKIQEIPKAVTPLSQPLNSESLREDDPFISGILNSEYELLEELMDDDLRKEIGELSSDEERSYTTPAITKVSKKCIIKSSSNTGDNSLSSVTNAENLKKAKGICETFNPVVEKIVLNPNTVDIKPSNSVSKAKPQILSNEKVNIVKRPDIIQQLPKKLASQISQHKPSHPNTNISSQNSNVDTNNMIITIPPQPSSNIVVIRPDMAYEPYPTLHITEAPINTQIKQSYVAANNTQTVNNIQLTPLIPVVAPVIVNRTIGLSTQMCNVNLPYTEVMMGPETMVSANIPLVEQSNVATKTIVTASVPVVKQSNAATKTIIPANVSLVNKSSAVTKAVAPANVPVVKQSNAVTKTLVSDNIPVGKEFSAATKTAPANVPVVKQSNAATKTVVSANVPVVKQYNAPTKTVLPANVPVVKQSNEATKTVVSANIPVGKEASAATKTVAPANVPVVKQSSAETKTVVTANVPVVQQYNASTKTEVPPNVPVVKQYDAVTKTAVAPNVTVVKQSNAATKTANIPVGKEASAATKTVVSANVPVVKQSKTANKIEMKAASGPSPSTTPDRMVPISNMKNKPCKMKSKKILKPNATILLKTHEGSRNVNDLSKPVFIHNPDKGIKFIKTHKPLKKQSRAGQIFTSARAKIDALLNNAIHQTKEDPIKISPITSKNPGKGEVAKSVEPDVKIDKAMCKKDEIKLKVEAQKSSLNTSQFEVKQRLKLNEVSETNEVPVPEIDIKPEIKQNNMDIIISKSCERKVLSEVQEKLTTPSSEKVENKLTRNQRLSTENEKTMEDKQEKEIINDRERLKTKRWAIINREISHRCFDTAIALPYAPIQIHSSRTSLEKERDLNALNDAENYESKQEIHTNSPMITSQLSECILFNSSILESPGNIENTLRSEKILDKSKGKVTTKKARKSKVKKAKMKEDKKAEICLKSDNDKQEKDTSGNVLNSMDIAPTRVSSRIRERKIKKSDLVSTGIDSENITKQVTSSEKQDIASTAITRYVQTEEVKKSEIPEVSTLLENKTIPMSELDKKVSSPSDALSSKIDLPTKLTPKLDTSKSNGQVENEIVQIVSSPEDTPDELIYPAVEKIDKKSNNLDCKVTSVNILSDDEKETSESVADTAISSPVISIVPKLVTSLCDNKLENVSDNKSDIVLFGQCTDDKSMKVTDDKTKKVNVISCDENGEPIVDTITIPPLPVEQQAISVKTDVLPIKSDDANQNKGVKSQATKNIINMDKSDSIPLSYKNSIIFNELPSPNPNNPSMRCVRIQIPNGKTFKATVYGQMKIDFDTLFENPALKNILLSGISDKKRFTFSVQQIATANREIIDTRVKFNSVLSKKNIDSEVVNLVSDDEDDCQLLTNQSQQKFCTEFGTYSVKSMEEDTYKNHQSKLSKKCSIILKNCDSLVNKPSAISHEPRKETLNQLIEAVLNSYVEDNNEKPSNKENNILYHKSKELISTATEIINLDDSSDEDSSSKTHSIEKIDELKNLLLKDLGVADVDSASSDKETENEQKSASRLKRSKSKKKFKAYVGSTTNDYSDIIPFKCFVKLTRCDNLVRDLNDDITESNVSNEDTDTNDGFEPKLYRSGSFSILNNLVGLDDVIELTEHDTDRSSPTIDVVQTITALQGSLEADSCILPDFIPILNAPNYNSYKTGLLCHSDWFDTKKDIQRSMYCDLIPETENHVDYIDSKTDVSTDYESDTDIALYSSNISDLQNISIIRDSSVPSLKKLMTDYYIRDSMNVCKTALITCKRKSIDELNEVANKVIKVQDSCFVSLESKTEANASFDNGDRNNAKECTEVFENKPILEQEIPIKQLDICLKNIVYDYIVNNFETVTFHRKYSTPKERYTNKLTNNQKQIPEIDNVNENKNHVSSSLKINDFDVVNLNHEKPHVYLPNTDLSTEITEDLFSEGQKCSQIEMSHIIEDRNETLNQINNTTEMKVTNTEEIKSQYLNQYDQNADDAVSIPKPLKETDFKINKVIAELNTAVEVTTILSSENESITESHENLEDKAVETPLSRVPLKTAQVYSNNDSNQSDKCFARTKDKTNSGVINVNIMENKTTTTMKSHSTANRFEVLEDKPEEQTSIKESQPDTIVTVNENSVSWDSEFVEKSLENQPEITESMENIIESYNKLKNRPENITGILKGAPDTSSEDNFAIGEENSSCEIDQTFAGAEDMADYHTTKDITRGVKIEAMLKKENVKSLKKLEEPCEINSLEFVQKKPPELNSVKKSPNIDKVSENKCSTILAITEEKTSAVTEDLADSRITTQDVIRGVKIEAMMTNDNVESLKELQEPNEITSLESVQKKPSELNSDKKSPNIDKVLENKCSTIFAITEDKSFPFVQDIADSHITTQDVIPGVKIETMVTGENVEPLKDLKEADEITSLELVQIKPSDLNSDKKIPNINKVSENKSGTIFAITDTEDTADFDIAGLSEELKDKTDISLGAENEAIPVKLKSNTTEKFRDKAFKESDANRSASQRTAPDVNQIKHHDKVLCDPETINEDVSIKKGGMKSSVCLDGNDNLTSLKIKDDTDVCGIDKTSETNTDAGSKDQEISKNKVCLDPIDSQVHESIVLQETCENNNVDNDIELDEVQVIAGGTLTLDQSKYCCETEIVEDSSTESHIDSTVGSPKVEDLIETDENQENIKVFKPYGEDTCKSGIVEDSSIKSPIDSIVGSPKVEDLLKTDEDQENTKVFKTYREDTCATGIVEDSFIESPIDSIVESPKVEDLIKTNDNQENIKVSKSYKEDTGVVLRGVEFDDPVVGTYYVFSLDKSSDSSANNSSATVETFEEMLINESDEILPAETEQWTDNSFDYNAELEVMIPKQTYSKRKLKRKLVMGDISLSVKKRRISKLKRNIDSRKLSNADVCDSLYVREFTRLMEYCSNIEFSYSISFHREQVDVDNILNDWPIKYDARFNLQKSEETDEVSMLFTDLDGKPPFDPLTQTLSQELITEYVLEESCETDDNNVNMGFGERSGRVNQNFESDGVTKFSAATLSDVKHSQPFLLSEDHDDCGSKHVQISREKDQIQKIRRSIAFIQLRNKVRSFFAKTAIELASDIFNDKDKENQSDSTSFPFDLYIPKSFQPAPSDVLVKVVQVGQLPVSAAAQNPVTCDPRVTQVSDASPSQCSEENSPRDDLQQGIKTEYTELTTADLSMPLETYQNRNQTIPIENQEAKTGDNIPIETELIKSEVKIELVEETSEDTKMDEKIDDANELPTSNHVNNVDYSYGTNNVNTSMEQNSNVHIIQPIQDMFSQQKQSNGAPEKTDQIAHAMSAAGISTTAEPLQNTRAQALVNIISQKIRQSNGNTAQNSINTYSKSSPITAMALQQALAQILPPPLNQTNVAESNQQGQTPTVTPQVLHIVQGKNASGNQITLVDNSQQSVINQNATPVLHIVQNKGPTSSASNSIGNNSQQQNPFSGLSLVDTGLQQGGNQLLHIVNTGNQKNTNAGQLLKRVNLLTNLTNVPGSNDQKMVQFVCKAADGKSIQLNAPHQRSMVLRLQPIESPNMPPAPPKPAENQDMVPSPNTPNTGQNKESSNSQQEIKSRSMYEENYAKFIQNSTTKSAGEKSTSLPKFNQAFGKSSFQDGNQKQTEISANNNHLTPPVNTNNDNSECPQSDNNSINLDHISQMSSPPLLLRKSPQTSQAQQNLVQQIKQTIAPMNIQTMHGGVIYTRQIPVNIGGGQTINLITVPSTELIDDKQQSEVKFVNQSGEIEPSIIKIVPQSQPAPNTEVTQDESNNHVNLNNENVQNPQPQPVLTQMRIKLPMLSKTPQVVSGARVVRPSFFQIQRNVIGGANQQVYQQLVLTAAPPLGQQTIRLPQAQTVRPVKVQSESQSSPESQMSSSTLEQLREFDMVLEQVKERSTVQPNSSGFKLNTTSNDTTDSNASGSSTPVETTQPVLYSIGGSQQLNVAYVNRKAAVATPSTSTFVRSPDSSSVTDSPGSSNQAQTSQSVTSEPSSSGTSSQSRPRVSSKSKSRPKSSHSQVKINSVPPKPTTQKPLEDEQTTQRILYILAEYKEQVENSPDKDKPAPRRRSNPPSNPGSSKRKKSSSGSRRPGARDVSPVQGDDACRTMGSEDSSCGTSQGDCTESCMETHSPQDSPRKVARKLTFEQETAVNQTRPQPQRNVIVADGQAITVARSAGGKPATAVLMPANYILPVSMVKGGQQIAIVTNRGPKLLTVGGGEGGGTNALLLQRLISPAGLKPVLTRPGVRHVRLPTAALHNLQTFNLAPATPAQPPDSTVSPAPAPTPPELIETRAENSPWTERESENVRTERPSSTEGSEPWNMPTSSEAQEYSYEETVRAENIDRTVLDPIPDRYSPDMEAQRIFDKMFDVESKKCFIVDSHDEPHCGYDVDASEDDKGYQVVQKKEGPSHRQHRVTHISAAALRHKYAILEHELRLQKSLSEECEDLGVDSPSASELFPEAELLFAASPAQDPGEASHHNPHTPQPTILNQTAIQPDIDDQIATDQLLPRADVPQERPELDNLGLGDVGIVTVSEDGMQATIALDQEEFARSHPNTTFHSEPTDCEVQQPFTITGIKGGRQISTIFHANRVPATVLMTAPQAGTVISQTAEPPPQGSIKYSHIDHMITTLPPHGNTVNLNSVLVKDDGLTRFDNILTDSRELHLSNTASAIVHPSGNATQVIRRVCYDEDKRERDARYLMDEPDTLIAGDDAKMIAEDNSRDATMESMAEDVDDDNSSSERHAELFWESNSASERSESRRPLDFSSDSEKGCKSPSYDETNSTDSSGVGSHVRHDSVIKEARFGRSGSAEGSSADDTHPPLRTYPPKRMFHNPEAETERSLSGKTRAGEHSPDLVEGRRRTSVRGVVKRGCHCCNGSPTPAPPRPKKPRQRKPTLDFNTNT